MKVSRFVSRRVFILTLAFLGILAISIPIQAQTNSWIGSGSGDWESPEWSFGLPGTNQDIFIANSGSKVIVIEPNTVNNAPQTLFAASLTIASPGDDMNEVLMNNSGLQKPLVLGDVKSLGGSLIVSSNSVFEMHGSSLMVCNWPYESSSPSDEFTVGGVFNESDSSALLCGRVYVGNIGPGTFNLTNSDLMANGDEYIVGSASTFNQHGGTNTCNAVLIADAGQYNLYAGTLSGSVLITGVTSGGGFSQYGGYVSGPLDLWEGGYTLNSGILATVAINAPAGNAIEYRPYSSTTITQNGGTNYAASVNLGNNLGQSSYVLTGGVLFVTNQISLGSGTNRYENAYYGWAGSFTQSGGYATNSGISLNGILAENAALETYIVSANYNLSGGILQTPVIFSSLGSFNQSGGTNILGANSGTYSMSGGWLSAKNIGGDFTQNGGTNQTIGVSGYYILNGGLLLASEITVSNGNYFVHAGGQCGVALLTLDNGKWQEQANGQQFGPLQLGAGAHSSIQFPSNACVLQFARSSGLNWSNSGILTVVNWNGSPNGGGTTQLIFGTNAAGLTTNQLSQIQFADPAGFAAGMYPATILTNGEVAPQGVPAVTNTAPAPFFAGEFLLGGDWYYLGGSSYGFGYFNTANFPYIYHLDMGWEYFIDAGNASRGAYFYDFTDNVFFYTDPDIFPYLYDFNLNTWVYYCPQSGATDRYTSNPRWFFDFNMQTWVNYL